MAPVTKARAMDNGSEPPCEVDLKVYLRTYRRATLLMLALEGLQTALEQYSLQDWDLKRRVLPLVDLAEEVHDDIRDARKREKEGTE